METVSQKKFLFNSGATEGNNFVIRNLVTNAICCEKKIQTYKPHFILNPTEHPSMFDPLISLKNQGCVDFDVCKVSPSGEVDVDSILDLIREETAFFRGYAC